MDKAREAVRIAMARNGFDNRGLAHQADLDEGTVGEFLRSSDRWPAKRTQHQLEDALGLPPGELDRIAREHPDTSQFGAQTSDVPATVNDVEVVEDSSTGRNVIMVKVAALGVEVSSTYVDEADRQRALATIWRTLRLDGGPDATTGDGG